jgi:hypothetical protein
MDILPPYNVHIYTATGQFIRSQMNVMQADLSGMQRGAYIVQYEKNGQRVAEKVIR